MLIFAKIKIFQIDWGGEYCKFHNFFQTIHIHHRLICPHTHEQNDIVERHHMHILETGFTILGQCKALLRFWNYTFETLYYLINRMPFLIFFFNILLIMIFCVLLSVFVFRFRVRVHIIIIN